mgnify:CR=1 FL=1
MTMYTMYAENKKRVECCSKSAGQVVIRVAPDDHNAVVWCPCGKVWVLDTALSGGMYEQEVYNFNHYTG